MMLGDAMEYPLLILLPLMLLVSCESAPRPFVEGAETPPPMGCIEGRERGVDC